jgi:hypothetical protein
MFTENPFEVRSLSTDMNSQSYKILTRLRGQKALLFNFKPDRRRALDVALSHL